MNWPPRRGSNSHPPEFSNRTEDSVCVTYLIWSDNLTRVGVPLPLGYPGASPRRRIRTCTCHQTPINLNLSLSLNLCSLTPYRTGTSMLRLTVFVEKVSQGFPGIIQAALQIFQAAL